MAEIASRFERIASQHPDLVAVKSGHRELTYRQLNTLADRLARQILARCPDGGATVALLLEHGADLAVGALACLKANRIYVPLERSNPHERQCRILDDAESRLLITDGTWTSPLPDEVQVLNMHEAHAAPPSKNPASETRDDDLAFLLYTSGSTGIPKGVMYRNDAVVARVAGYNRLGAGPGDRLTALGPGGMNLFRALLNGATLVSLDLRSVPIDRLAGWLRDERITIYHSVPAVFRRFVATLSGKERFPDLRIVNLTGETVLSRDVAAFRRHFPDRCILINGLGTTEAGTFRELRIERTTFVADGVVPVGSAVEGTEVLLLDGSGNEVKPGEAGEIAVRGEHLSPGYWKRPELTRERFLPGGGSGSRRIYRTGDLGRFLPDGSLLHLGREDFQVKIRGNRVEVGEVEAALLHHPGIKDAAVLGQPRDDGDVRLVGYVVPTGTAPPRSDGLASFLRRRLPDHMVPVDFVFLQDLPVTPNGKIDRRALPRHGPGIPTAAIPLERPRNETEELLAGLWTEILRIPPKSIHDDFFALGGDSLSAARLMGRIHATLRVELPIGVVFDASTIARLAQRIAAAVPQRPSTVR